MCGGTCDRCRTAKAYGFAVPHGGAVTATPAATHPASRNGGVRPTGSDRSTAIAQRHSTFARGTMVENPQRNQAEAGVPHASKYGAGLRALVAGGHVVRVGEAPVLPQTTGGFRGFVGYLRAAAARAVIVPKGTSYTGVLPMEQQPRVSKARPWSDSIPIGARYTG
jgi:hypothetical protein